MSGQMSSVHFENKTANNIISWPNTVFLQLKGMSPTTTDMVHLMTKTS